MIQAAIEKFSELAQATTEFSPPYENLYRLCEKQGQFTEAINALNKAIEIHPRYQPHQGALQQLYLKLYNEKMKAGQRKAATKLVHTAIKNFNEIADRAPGLATPYEQLSVFCEKRGRLKEAIETLGKAIEIHPDYKPHKFRLAKLHVARAKRHDANSRKELGQSSMEVAIGIYTKLAEDNPEQAAAHERLSEIYEWQERYTDAIAAKKKAIEIHPDYQPHQIRLVALTVAFAKKYNNSKEYAEAVEILTGTIDFLDKFSPDHERLVRLLDMASEFQEHLGQFDKALQLLERASRIWPHEHFLTERIGILLEKSKRIESAEATFLRLLENNQDSASVIEIVARFYQRQAMPLKSETIVKEAMRRGVNFGKDRDWLAKFKATQTTSSSTNIDDLNTHSKPNAK